MDIKISVNALEQGIINRVKSSDLVPDATKPDFAKLVAKSIRDLAERDPKKFADSLTEDVADVCTVKIMRDAGPLLRFMGSVR